jgi:DNA-binding response OmpR family regulator
MAKKKRILIAEDETSIGRALALKLEGSGYEAVVTKDGEEAVAALEKEKFDMLLLDLIMPKKDGFGVLESMKAKGDKTPVIVLTNLSQEEDQRRVKGLGAIGFFVKSDTPLTAIVKEVEKTLP